MLRFCVLRRVCAVCFLFSCYVCSNTLLLLARYSLLFVVYVSILFTKQQHNWSLPCCNLAGITSLLLPKPFARLTPGNLWKTRSGEKRTTLPLLLQLSAGIMGVMERRGSSRRHNARRKWMREREDGNMGIWEWLWVERNVSGRGREEGRDKIRK